MVAFTTYGADGRPACSALRYVSTTLAAANTGSCVSSFTENASYARATAYSYRGATVGGRGYLAVKTVPPENNAGGGAAGTESFYDAAGALQFATDAEGGTVRLLYDPLGRTTESRREAVATVNSTTIVPDLMGRVSNRIDPNFGTRSFTYDPQTGLLAKMVFTNRPGDPVQLRQGARHADLHRRGANRALHAGLGLEL